MGWGGGERGGHDCTGEVSAACIHTADLIYDLPRKMTGECAATYIAGNYGSSDYTKNTNYLPDTRQTGALLSSWVASFWLHI